MSETFIKKSKLAKKYFPECSRDYARRKLTRWIHDCPELYKALCQTDYNPAKHDFAPTQVALIYHYLGEP
ncbi:MAG: DUF4248 domain-containing protein [Bacteroidales bacterium]|jgi:hypothetical protein|nr:DUF4248 domain-containing protein [Bacteroidales bacterium]